MDATAEILKAKYHAIRNTASDIDKWFSSLEAPVEQAITLQGWFSDNQDTLSSLPIHIRTTVEQVAKDRFAEAMRERVNHPDPYLTIQPRGAR